MTASNFILDLGGHHRTKCRYELHFELVYNTFSTERENLLGIQMFHLNRVSEFNGMLIDELRDSF